VNNLTGDGFSQLLNLWSGAMNPHLNFNGDCEAAFKFYERCLGGKIQTMLPHAETPISGMVPPEWRKKILHASLTLGNQVLMGADMPPESYRKPQSFAVTLGLSDAAEAERVFRELAEEGSVTMPIQETFWAERFGMLVDRFGIPWMINCGSVA
jgi:PhnB protein